MEETTTEYNASELGKKCAEAAKESCEQFLEHFGFTDVEKVDFWAEFFRELNRVD